MMARINRSGFVAIAVLFHVVYIYSIFDIYFVSPIVHGMQAFPVNRPSGADAPAQRLVLYVGDGLRADKAFQSFPDPSPPNPGSQAALKPRPLAPFLRSKVESHGTFGVSHTRVPTESRPGHVALIAGLYEDVSAVATGWKLNPVNFDSVFNRSRHTWSWGSPDILPMFKEGAVPGRVDADHYDAEFEDFKMEATELDTWVFERVEALFKSAASNSTLNALLRKDKNVFFLHLLGLDTTGHGYRPYSKEYLHNIKVVDEGVKRITKIVDDFFNDGKTAYVFTADHGMSDWGSHGDGHPDNTRTPLIVWGSGAKKPVTVKRGKAPGHEDGFSSDWGLNHVARHDVAQADVAALMAYLAGLEFPTNSVGKLPLEYISAPPAEQAEAAFANVQGILEMYRVKEEQKRAVELNYKPYPAFSSEQLPISHRTAAIRALIDNKNYTGAIAESHELLDVGIEAMRYLQTYDWLFLRALVSLGYLGWMAFALTTVIDLHVLQGRKDISRSSTASTVVFGAISVALASFLIARRSPITYYAYAIFPIVFWEEVFAQRAALLEGGRVLLGHIKSSADLVGLLVKSAAGIAAMELLVLSYFYREVYTACYILLIFWPFFYGKEFVRQNKALIANWTIGCSLMSTFTLLPAIKVENSNTILLGGFMMLCAGVLYLLFDQSLTGSASVLDKQQYLLSRVLVGVQVGLVLLAMIVTRSSVASLQAKQGLATGDQVVGWIVLVSSLIVPFLHSRYPNKNYLHRLVIIFLTFSPVFIILTISYEGVLYFSFCVTLVAWVRMEHHVYTFLNKNVAQPAEPAPQPKPLRTAATDVVQQLRATDEGASTHHFRSLTLSDTRTALFFFFFLQSAFFSTGNIASVSSFSLDSVSRLIVVFNPFSQTALLLLKLMAPFAVISANLGILNRRLDVAPSALFMVVMAISDVLTMNFFWLVRDEGSWLDIGTSISHFVIASLLCVFVSGLEFVSEVFVSGVVIGNSDGLVPPQEAKKVGIAAPQSNGSAKANGKTKKAA